MDVPATLRRARHTAGLSQAELAACAGTSQATVSAYESGAKAPSVATLDRLLAAVGRRLAAVPGGDPLVLPSLGEQRDVARELRAVIDLAAALPTDHHGELRYPRLPTTRS